MSEPTEEQRLDRLRQIPLFAELTDGALKRILDHATEFEARHGHVLVQPDQPGAGLFVIEDGTATVELRDRKIELGPGEFFGELALLDERAVHTGRVCATSPQLRCLAIARDDFDDLLQNEPKMAVAMLKALAHRLAVAG
ncbi:MAG TPA: Crp/Fnr family transcriptional regulator [Actinomycetota bacterium]|nr:Crp/Fnr family transcriptional regulator [Actinomycetota bacterium]